MRYIKGIQRNQSILFPESIDEYIEENNLVRFIEAYVESLDMQELDFTYSEPKETGRKPYNPGSMLKLYIYGYLQRIRSSRRLETETQRNVELMWLMEKLTPDFKTIADFRRDNINSIKKVCREFTIFCRKLGLYGGELAAIDGSKFKAVNSKDKCYTRNFLKSELKEIDIRIEQYLKEIEKTDKREQKLQRIEKEKLEEIIKNINKERKEVTRMLEEIEGGTNSQISQTDPDSRMMLTSGKGYQVSYNGQISVDSKHHMIIESKVTNEVSDRGQLHSMAEKTKQMLELEELKVVCDSGYYNEEQISKCESNKIECYIATPKTPSHETAGRYGLKEFQYKESKDVYICPQGKELTYLGSYKKHKGYIKRYECSECKRCPVKSECTNSKNNRYIDRSEYIEAIEKTKNRTEENKEFLRVRKK